MRTNMTKCLCTGMVYDPEAAAKKEQAQKQTLEKKKSIIGHLFKTALF